MAIFNEILSGRYNRALQKIFAIKGKPPVRQLGGEVTPVHFLFSGVENRFLEQWNRFGSAEIQPALAAQNSAIVFRNPKTSGVVAVIERLSVSESVADAQLLITQDTLTSILANAAGIRCLDNRPARAGQTLGSACQISSGNAFAVTGGVIARANLAANQEFGFIATDNQEITVLPGDQIEVVTAQVNVALQTSWFWRERALEDSELF